MGAWIDRNFAWKGLTSRDEYRRWLPLILLVDLTLIWALVAWGERGTINLGNFGWAGAAIFMAGLPYFVGWVLLTGRRLRSADISRSWLIPAVLTINIPIGDVHINVSAVAMMLLTVISAVAGDRVPSSAT